MGRWRMLPRSAQRPHLRLLGNLSAIYLPRGVQRPHLRPNARLAGALMPSRPLDALSSP